MVDSQMDSTLLSDLVKYCGVFEDVILHEVSLMSFGRYQYRRCNNNQTDQKTFYKYIHLRIISGNGFFISSSCYIGNNGTSIDIDI